MMRLDAELATFRLRSRRNQASTDQVIQSLSERLPTDPTLLFDAFDHIVIQCHRGSDAHDASRLASETTHLGDTPAGKQRQTAGTATEFPPCGLDLFVRL